MIVSSRSTSSKCPRIARFFSDFYGPFPSFEPRRVVVTGLGLITPLGLDVNSTWERLLNAETAISKLQQTDLPEEQRGAFESLPCKIAASVPMENFKEYCKQKSIQIDASRQPKFVQFALAAAHEAIQQSQCLTANEKIDLGKFGVAIGSGMSATSDLAQAGQIIGQGNAR